MQRFPDQLTLRVFLESERRSSFIAECISILFLLVAAAAILVGTYAAIFAIVFLIFPKWGSATHWCALGYIASVFISYRNHDSGRLSKLSVGTLDGRPAWSIWVPGGMHLSNVNMLSPSTLGSMAKIITQVLFAAPASLGAAWRAVQKARALSGADVGPAVAVFELLLRKGKRVPYAELGAASGASPASVLSLLLLLNLVQHLPSEPAGMVVLSSVSERLLK